MDRRQLHSLMRWIKYGPQATSFLDALDHFFEQINERQQSAIIEWGKLTFTQCLAKYEDAPLVLEAPMWEMLTYLRAATRFSRFPDNNDGGWFAEHFANGGVGRAMTRLRFLTAPSAFDVDRILALKSTFDSLTADEFRTWGGWEKIEIEGDGDVLHVPYPSYHPVVQEWSEMVWETPFYIDPYHGVKDGDPIPHPKFLNIGEPGHQPGQDFFSRADLFTVRQYMAVCIRGEKWCDGHIAGEFERGVIQAAFARLDELARMALI